MSLRTWRGSTVALCLIAAAALRAGEPDPAAAEAPKDRTFKLGETVVVSARQDPIETVNTRVEADQIQAFDRDTVGKALELLPGVSYTVTGARNEQVVYVRGFDARQVPVFLDGIPVYVPYDGLVDYGRFTTFDISEIQVEKGFSSVAFGPNTLGGAVNLVTRRPAEPLEGDLRLGVFDGNGRKAAVNAGSNQGRWYVQAGASQAQADYFKLSSQFVPNARENGGKRENSDYVDKKVSFKAGFTPNDRDEYAIGALKQTGEKGDPVSTDLAGRAARYWRWPTWDKQSLYLVSNTGLGEASYLRLRAYYDIYQNILDTYTNASYQVLSAAPSVYDDFTHGVMLEAGTDLLARHSLKAVLQTKTDVHRQGTGSLPSSPSWTNFHDQYFTAGLEDSITLGERLDLSLGLGWDRLQPVHTGPQDQSRFHGQAGLFYKLAPAVQVYATFAQKTRFPTLKECFSDGLGTLVPNPNLMGERSTNYELGVKAGKDEWLQAEAAVFLSDIRDLIQSVAVSATQSQYQNIDKARNSGVELALTVKPGPAVQGGAAYTYLDRANLGTGARYVVLCNTPRNHASAWLKVRPLASWFVQAAVLAQDAQWDNSVTSRTITRLGGFTTVDLTLGWEPTPALTFDGGFTNPLDRNYQLGNGYPMPGRSAFLNARYRF